MVPKTITTFCSLCADIKCASALHAVSRAISLVYIQSESVNLFHLSYYYVYIHIYICIYTVSYGFSLRIKYIVLVLFDVIIA